MKGRRVAAVGILLCNICVSSTALAWGWGPIKPGDHVFDAKRWADSVKETAEMIKVVQNELENLKNRIVAMTKINVDLSGITAVLKDTMNTTGESIVNYKNGFAPVDDIYRRSWSIFQQHGDCFPAITEGAGQSNEDTYYAVQQAIKRKAEREEELHNVMNQYTDGLLGEQQRENAVFIMNTMNEMDKGAVTGAAWMNEVTMQETERDRMRVDYQRLKEAATFHAYDPYHPTDYDIRNRPVSSVNYGFLKFGQ